MKICPVFSRPLIGQLPLDMYTCNSCKYLLQEIKMLLKKIQMHTVQESFQLLVILHCTTPHTRGICIVKWSWNFDSGTPSAIFGSPLNSQNGSFWFFLAILGVPKRALGVPKSKF